MKADTTNPIIPHPALDLLTIELRDQRRKNTLLKLNLKKLAKQIKEAHAIPYQYNRNGLCELGFIY